MISARKALIGMARERFEGHLSDIVKWSDVAIDEPQRLPDVDRNGEPVAGDGRRNPLGKYRPLVILRFGNGFRLEVASPEEAPPLGRLELYKGTRLHVDGTLDDQVWRKAVAAIKEQHHGG